jgi:hypothetical protein
MGGQRGDDVDAPLAPWTTRLGLPRLLRLSTAVVSLRLSSTMQRRRSV